MTVEIEDLQDISIDLIGGATWIVMVPLAIFVVCRLYAKTKPTTGSTIRWTLATVRSATFVLLLVSMAEPAISMLHRVLVPPQLSILLDRSPSMAVVESGVSRMGLVAGILDHAQFQQRLEKVDASFTAVSDTAEQISRETAMNLSIVGQSTDLARGIRLGGQQLTGRTRSRSMLLISDGSHNLGEDPVNLARELGIPVFVLGVGSAEAAPDIRLVDVDVSDSAYMGHPLTLTVNLVNHGFTGAPSEVVVMEGEDTLATQKLVLSRAGQTQSVSIDINPKAAGPQYFRVLVEPHIGEGNRSNNETLAFAKILGARIRVLLVAGGPSHELSFLSRSLAADSSIAVSEMVYKHRETAYEDRWDELSGADVVILSNTGPGTVSAQHLKAIAANVEKGTGLLIVGGKKAFQSWMANENLERVLPVQLANAEYVVREIPVRVAEDRQSHPVLSPLDSDVWAHLAPLSGYVPTTKEGQRGISLIYAPVDNDPPLIVAGTYGSGKVVVALSTSFWRLDLVTSGAGGQSQGIRQFWQSSVRWLGQRENSGRLQAEPERQVYRAGEPLAFTAQVFDEFSRAQSGAEVTVVFGDVSIQLEEVEGEYRGTWDRQGLQPGSYSFNASARLAGNVIGEDRGEFVIERHSVEDGDLRADTLLLQQIAQVSGGRYGRVDEWPVLMRSLNLQTQILEDIETHRLWGSIWPMVAAIALLAAEWTVRKRIGMI